MDPEATGVHEAADPSAPRPDPPVWVAAIPVVFLIAALFVTIKVLGLSPHMPLVLATAVAGIVGRIMGVRWSDLQRGIVGGITVALPACLILMIIGTLIGTWILSGIVPTLIVYGLEIVSPAYFLVSACAVCSVVSLATGSSWSTAGTVGIALVGIGSALGIPPGMTAGAIISGSYFGDKMSPLSDTTNLAPAVAGTDLMTHVRHMVYTAGPSLIFALVAYLILGFRFDGGGAQAGSLQAMVTTIKGAFSVHWWLLLPALAVIGMVAARVPALPALLTGTLLGGLCAWLAQGAGLKAILTAAQSGFVAKTGVASVDKLLSRGGLESMMSTVALILCALSFGGIMERTGMLGALARAILWRAKSTGSLVVRTLLTCIGMNILVADQYMSIVIPGRMYKDVYRARGLHPKNLSRALEDSGTMTSGLVPWNTGGAYMSTTLGVATLSYVPYAFVNLLNPLISAFYGYTGLTMHPAEDAEQAPLEDPAPEDAADGDVA